VTEDVPDLHDNGQDGRQANEQLFVALYAELRRLADRELQRHPGMHVSPTTLVHEVYLNFADREGLSFTDRARFLSYAARAMRGLLIDLVRSQLALKRGGGFAITQLSTHVREEVAADSARLVQVSDALDALATRDPRLAEVVDLKYFCGFSFAEIANLRAASQRTVKRDWEKARALLHQLIGGNELV
jgi:RNA polymerase sigma factor (TIGR02999 family)